jgi:hypothetical protein
MTTTRDDLRGVEYRRYDRPRSVRSYGYENGRPIAQAGAPSGHLLPWPLLDDEAEAIAQGRPSAYVVTGEYLVEGFRYPEYAVSDTYMKWLGYERSGHHWKRVTDV